MFNRRFLCYRNAFLFHPIINSTRSIVPLVDKRLSPYDLLRVECPSLQHGLEEQLLIDKYVGHKLYDASTPIAGRRSCIGTFRKKDAYDYKNDCGDKCQPRQSQSVISRNEGRLRIRIECFLQPVPMLIVNGFLYSFLWKFPKPALNVDIKKGPNFIPIPHFPRYISKFNSAIILIICISLQLHHLICVLIQIPSVADI